MFADFESTELLLTLMGGAIGFVAGHLWTATLAYMNRTYDMYHAYLGQCFDAPEVSTHSAHVSTRPRGSSGILADQRYQRHVDRLLIMAEAISGMWIKDPSWKFTLIGELEKHRAYLEPIWDRIEIRYNKAVRPLVRESFVTGAMA